MSENIPRLFPSEAEVYGITETEENKALAIPQTDNLPIAGDDYLVSPPVHPSNPVKSVDQRIKQAMRPPMDDTEVLKPKTFNLLLNETYLSLAKEIELENVPEAKESLNSLRLLLKENVDLSSMFLSYTNWLQKA